jgi:hypothetical protein
MQIVNYPLGETMKKTTLLTSLFAALTLYSVDLIADEPLPIFLVTEIENQTIAGDTLKFMRVRYAPEQYDSLQLEIKIAPFPESRTKPQLIIGSAICTLDTDSEWKQITFNQKDTIKMIVYQLGYDSLFKISYKVNLISSTSITLDSSSTWIKVKPSNIYEIKISSHDSIPYSDTVNISGLDGFLSYGMAYDKYGNYRRYEKTKWSLNSFMIENVYHIYLGDTDLNESGYLYATSVTDNSIRDSIYINIISSGIIIKQNGFKKNNLQVNKANDLLGRNLINSTNQVIIKNGRKKLKVNEVIF